MNEVVFRNWLDAYGRAWRERIRRLPQSSMPKVELTR
jgi:hypothetical protein